MTKPARFINGVTNLGCGAHFTPGHWRADAPNGTPIPEPEKPLRAAHIPVSTADNRTRDPRTADNIAERSEALAPRRWKAAR